MALEFESESEKIDVGYKLVYQELDNALAKKEKESPLSIAGVYQDGLATGLSMALTMLSLPNSRPTHLKVQKALADLREENSNIQS